MGNVLPLEGEIQLLKDEVQLLDHSMAQYYLVVSN